jgi:transcription factor AP-4
LETIVEAIRHLEGDNLFSDNTEEGGGGRTQEAEPQEVPLALTKHATSADKHVLKVKMNQYLQFHPQGSSGPSQQQQQQQRPGVIVVKQHT